MADRPVQPVADQSSSSSRSNSSNEPLTHSYQDSRGSGDTTSSSVTNGSESRPVAAPSSNLKASPPQICQPSVSGPGKASHKFLDAHRDSRIYPIVEISRVDQTKQQVLEALHHIERKKANAPNLISPNFGAPQGAAQLPDSGIILSYIEDLEKKVANLHARNPANSSEAASGVGVEPAEVKISATSDPPPMKPWIVEIKRFKKLNYRYGSAELYDDSETIEAIRAREAAARGGGYVLNVYREYDWEGNALNSKLEICSTPLLELIRDLIDYYPGPEFDLLRWEDTVGDTVTFCEPYMMLFTHRSEMKDSLQRTDIPEETKNHVRLLLQFLSEEMSRTSAKLDEIETGTCKKITFQDLWLLYVPNTPVYISVNGEDRQMVVYSRNVPEKNLKGQWGVLSLYCWSSKYEGGKLRRDFCPWVIQPFSGEKALHHLDLVPMKYLRNQEAVRARLIARGNQYYQLNQGPALRDYYGNKFPRVFKDEPIRVVVDQETYWQKHGIDTSGHEDPSEEYGFPLGEEALEGEDGKPLERALVCCHPQVGVFSLRDKEWGSFETNFDSPLGLLTVPASVRVDDLQPVRFREKAFKRLVIKDEYKKLIIAMVEAYMLEQPGFSDIVGGKGRGLIVLLHGPPGTGKTLTAECISERQMRPLYSVSCGDLGTEPVELERRLKEVFSYAVAWKAILLMDEADIFLQERDIHDVNRNALVSIFLRELEYFDGILFLTTNRPGDIDEAFQSRIHVSIGLKNLDAIERRKVWAVFIKEMDLSDREKATLLEYVTENFDGDRLNGRQIRNCVRTALALAQLKKEKINADHLERVVKIGREFSSYMEDLNKMNAEEYAIALGRRAPAR